MPVLRRLDIDADPLCFRALTNVSLNNCPSVSRAKVRAEIGVHSSEEHICVRMLQAWVVKVSWLNIDDL